MKARKKKIARPEEASKATDLIDYRLGPYQKTLRNLVADALISDTPYSAKTHNGNRAARVGDGGERASIDYGHFTPGDVRRFVRFWHPRTRGWFVVMTDHLLMPVWEKALEDAGRYVFAGLPCIIPGMTSRFAGDGPAREAVYLVVARWRTAEAMAWRSTRGFYKNPRDRWSVAAGSKPLAMMERIIEDYSNPGDVVVDPCAGGGTTLYGAARMGRFGVGSEIDPKTHTAADAALRGAYTPDLYAIHQWRSVRHENTIGETLPIFKGETA